MTVAKIRSRRSRRFTAGWPQNATILLENGRWLQHHLDGLIFFKVTKPRAALVELQWVITSITACCCSQ